MVDCAPGGNIGGAIEKLRDDSEYFTIISRNHKDNRGKQLINYEPLLLTL